MDKIGRMFAVVQVCGKQFKVTENDIIIVEGFWPPNIGDRLKLEKVLLVGSTDFTLVGRPLLNRELISVDVTVIEKTLSHTKTRFRFRKRKQYRRINFFRIQHTMLRINCININGNIDEKKEVEGLDRVY
ncbi:39S ribosomal protein L21, mitochondrial [Formica exsecta]|uniref:39S ribosomal protein L21, mitochondrial n=1 Tax=Formica exsecta TaxID=72781 RepID=UPI001144A005|nr:39S ribosomal protein L21, mitochondrial [Formica exsecta]